MQLYYTPRSHFSRKVRILMAALDLSAELLDVGNVADTNELAFGPNPLMKVPTLVDGTVVVFDSDHICQYLVQKYDPLDQFGVLILEVDVCNARAILNSIMAAEVDLILAARTGVATEHHPRFDKVKLVIRYGLEWLEKHSALFSTWPLSLSFHLVCMWDHLLLFGNMPTDLALPNLAARIHQLEDLPYISSTKPQ